MLRCCTSSTHAIRNLLEVLASPPNTLGTTGFPFLLNCANVTSSHATAAYALRTPGVRHFTFIRDGRRVVESSTESSSTYNPDAWREDKHFQVHKKAGLFKQILKVGPYKRGRFWVHPKDDPWSFAMNCTIVGITIYSILNLTPGESMQARRKRIIRERLLSEYGLTEADMDVIEGDEAPLSDAAGTSSIANNSNGNERQD